MEEFALEEFKNGVFYKLNHFTAVYRQVSYCCTDDMLFNNLELVSDLDMKMDFVQIEIDNFSI